MTSSANRPTAGVIGLGAMGGGVAASLLRAGIRTWGYDVNPAGLARFASAGGDAAASAADLAARADVVILFVVSAAQVDAVLFGPEGIADRLAPGAVVACCATVPAAFAEQLGTRLAERDLLFLDAPVSGGAARAQKGELTIMASGPEAAFAKAEPVLAAIAAKVYRLGDKPGTGSKVKTVNQLLAGVHIAAAAEAMAMGIRAGVEPRLLYDVISNSAGSSWMFQNRVPHILEGDYTPLSAVDIFVKDLGIVLDSARGMTFPLPLASAAHQLFLAASAHGHGREDDSAVIKVFAALAGLDLPPTGKP